MTAPAATEPSAAGLRARGGRGSGIRRALAPIFETRGLARVVLWVGAAITAGFVLIAILARWISPYGFDQYRANGERFPKLAAPSSAHLFGTNVQSTDVLSRVLYGAQTELKVVVIALAMALVVGVPLGLLSGYFGGKIDRALVLVMDALFAFPYLLLAIVIAFLLADSIGKGVFTAAVAITAVYVPQYFRVVRNQVLSVKAEPYVEAARSLGAKPRTIIGRYITFNVIQNVPVIATLNAADAILTLAALGFLGYGIQPTEGAEWGYDVQRAISDASAGIWWTGLFPGLAIVLLVTGLTLFGEALNDVLNPVLRARRLEPVRFDASETPRRDDALRSAEPVLSVRKLKVYYGTSAGPVRAVDDVSFDIAPSETLGLVGESGCGKSSLGRGILGLLPRGAASAGEVMFGGHNLVGLSAADLRQLRGPQIGLIFQDPMTRLDPLMTIDDHFREAIREHEPNVRDAEVERRSLDVLGRMGIPPTRFRNYPHEFSGGMRQRIMIALALVLRPKLLIADEPTTSLDVIVEAQILGILADLKENFDTALLLVTHNVAIVAEACDRVAVMYAGKIVEQGPAHAVFTEPAHPYTRELLRSTISLSTSGLHYIPGAPPDLRDPPRACRFHPRCPNVMRVCASKDPIEVAPERDRRVLCWLHGPDDEIPEGGTTELERGMISVAEEA
jgi:oligopeptide/dipeptide ABC transporter ATP-binding protein